MKIIKFGFCIVCIIRCVYSHSKTLRQESMKFCQRSQFCSQPSRLPFRSLRQPSPQMQQNTRRNWTSWKHSWRDLPATDWITWRSCTSSSLMFRFCVFRHYIRKQLCSMVLFNAFTAWHFCVCWMNASWFSTSYQLPFIVI